MSRNATLEDMPELLEMARAFHDHSNPAWPYSEKGMRGFFEALIQSPQGLVLISHGFLAAVKQPNPLNQDWVIANEILWWGDAGLFRRFKKWAQDADERRFSCPPEALANKFFGRMGSPVEIMYSEVQPCVSAG